MLEAGVYKLLMSPIGASGERTWAGGSGMCAAREQYKLLGLACVGADERRFYACLGVALVNIAYLASCIGETAVHS